jgi:hypothetical protein
MHTDKTRKEEELSVFICVNQWLNKNLTRYEKKHSTSPCPSASPRTEAGAVQLFRFLFLDTSQLNSSTSLRLWSTCCVRRQFARGIHSKKVLNGAIRRALTPPSGERLTIETIFPAAFASEFEGRRGLICWSRATQLGCLLRMLRCLRLRRVRRFARTIRTARGFWA